MHCINGFILIVIMSAMGLKLIDFTKFSELSKTAHIELLRKELMLFDLW